MVHVLLRRAAYNHETFMLIGPRYKICKRLGSSVFEKCQTQKFQLIEGRGPKKRRGRGGGSDFGAQLLEKQKARFTYGLTESQFSRYVHEAMDTRGKDSAQELLSRLESRLDNAAYRLGLATTRRAARQMVSHGHICINGRRVTIPSYRLSVGDKITVREGSKPSPLFTSRAEALKEVKVPSWLQIGEQGFSAEVVQKPTVGETEAPFTAPTIIQFYSR